MFVVGDRNPGGPGRGDGHETRRASAAGRLAAAGRQFPGRRAGRRPDLQRGGGRPFRLLLLRRRHRVAEMDNAVRTCRHDSRGSRISSGERRSVRVGRGGAIVVPGRTSVTREDDGIIKRNE